MSAKEAMLMAEAEEYGSRLSDQATYARMLTVNEAMVLVALERIHGHKAKLWIKGEQRRAYFGDEWVDLGMFTASRWLHNFRSPILREREKADE